MRKVDAIAAPKVELLVLADRSPEANGVAKLHEHVRALHAQAPGTPEKHITVNTSRKGPVAMTAKKTSQNNTANDSDLMR